MIHNDPRPRPAASYADLYTARRLLRSSEGSGSRLLQAQLFGYDDFGHMRLSIPPPIENVITVQTSGITRLQGKLGRPFSAYTAGPGDMLILPEGEPSEWEWTTSCEVLCIYLDSRFLAEICADATDHEPVRVELGARSNHTDPLVYQLGLAIQHELAAPGPASSLYLDSLAQTLALHLVRTHGALYAQPKPVRSGLATAALQRVQEYIEAQLASNLSQAEVAAVAGMSQYYFARQFRRSTGMSLHHYVVERRLEVARLLLLEGRYSVVEIAGLTGFADQSHLHRLFKERFGVTPGTVRREGTKIQPERTDLQESQPGNLLS